jgi:NADPH:quinone reductase-like Zn-dependent oxidoreductase
MRAVIFTEYGGPEVLHVADVEEPHPGPGQVRIAVRAEAVNPVDWKARSGAMREVMPVDFPAIDGREASGVVDEVGPDVTDAAVGDEVLGFAVGGAAAERAILDDFAPKPAALPWEEAAAMPVAVETSVRVFGILGGVREGQTLVIDGAAGGVGLAAVQLARARGARVIGTASERNHDFLRSLGAEPTTYGDGLVERVRALAPDGVDLGFDAAGQGGVADLVTLTGDPGRVVTIADFGAAALGVRVAGGSDRRAVEALGEATRLYEAGRLQIHVARTFPFAQAAEAHRLSQDGHVRGKLVLLPEDGR